MHMFDTKEFYKDENQKVMDSYGKSVELIRRICGETEDNRKYDIKIEYQRFFNHSGKLLLKLSDLERNINDEYYNEKTFEELKKENTGLFCELFKENYGTSYANPRYCVEIFGEDFGQLVSALYTKFRSNIGYCYKHKIFKMEKVNKLFIDSFNYVKNNNPDYTEFRDVLSDFIRSSVKEACKYRFIENNNKDYKFYTDSAKLADKKDLRYLFRFGEYVTDNEIETARFLFDYPEDKINTLAEALTRAYINGFKRDNKDITKRSSVRIINNMGMELVVNRLIECLKKENLNGFISAVEGTDANKQYDYDHRFDDALYINKGYLSSVEKELESSAINSKSILSDYSGIIVFEKFGEAPFAPEHKKECLKLSDEQTMLMQSHEIKINEIFERFIPETETSFCIIAFPIPEIGNNYKEIFDEVFEINMLDSKKYEAIQKNIIDVLDKGSFVHIKGRGNNLTDIKVKLHDLKNPEMETNFENCVADVNIPVGEVFTSPVLKGTQGLLHLKEIFLGDLKYMDLKLTFEDGYISGYSCKNFDSDEENKKYIEENLLFPHKTLPIGEFAIGTNTYAYAMAKKYKIVNLLPILIVEKMGPHFAIGDTCFSWAEDTPVYNPSDGKEIIARDNEKSILRKTKIDEAYTNIHTDITLPYDELQFISVVTEKNERIDVIKDGRFVLQGTEELNKALPENI